VKPPPPPPLPDPPPPLPPPENPPLPDPPSSALTPAPPILSLYAWSFTKVNVPSDDPPAPPETDLWFDLPPPAPVAKSFVVTFASAVRVYTLPVTNESYEDTWLKSISVSSPASEVIAIFAVPPSITVLVVVPSDKSLPFNCHWYPTIPPPGVFCAAIEYVAISSTDTNWPDGWEVISITGNTVIVPIPDCNGSLNALPVDLAVPAVTADPAGWEYADGI